MAWQAGQGLQIEKLQTSKLGVDGRLGEGTEESPTHWEDFLSPPSFKATPHEATG